MHRPRLPHLSVLFILALSMLSCRAGSGIPSAPPAAAQQPADQALATATRTDAAAPTVAPPAVADVSTAPPTTAGTTPNAPTLIAAANESDTVQVEAVDFSGLEAKRHVDVLAGEIGSRPAGSPSQARAAEYIRSQLAALGYQADLQPFRITSFQDRGSALIVAALGRPVPAGAMTYSSTGEAEGELVDVGLARPSDVSVAGVGGRIALIQRGETRFADKVDNVERAGAVAAIIYNNQPGSFNGSLASPARIPVISIAQEDGAELVSLLRRGAVAGRVTVDAGVEEGTAANVVATKPGGPQTVYIGGHFDSVPAGPGANDNASGTAVMLELARVLASRPSPYTLKFVAFDAEEIGLLGSAHLVGQLSAEDQRSIRAMINLDMVGVGDQPMFGGSDDLTRLAFSLSSNLGQTPRTLGDGLNGASDHASFIRAGIPAVFFYRADDPNYHSPNDRSELVDPEHLRFAGRVALGFVDALGGTR